MDTHTITYTHAHIHTFAHTHAHIHTFAHTHAHIHTRKPPSQKFHFSAISANQSSFEVKFERKTETSLWTLSLSPSNQPPHETAELLPAPTSSNSNSPFPGFSLHPSLLLTHFSQSFFSLFPFFFLFLSLSLYLFHSLPFLSIPNKRDVTYLGGRNFGI